MPCMSKNYLLGPYSKVSQLAFTNPQHKTTISQASLSVTQFVCRKGHTTHSSAMSNLYLIHHELDLHISKNRDRVGDNYSLQNKTKPTNFLGRSRIRLGCKIATGRRRRRHGSKVQVEGHRERRPRPALSGSGQESRVRTLLGPIQTSPENQV